MEIQTDISKTFPEDSVCVYTQYIVSDMTLSEVFLDKLENVLYGKISIYQTE